eukprot:1159933-Pelagomonas_calceolata.AAC.6
MAAGASVEAACRPLCVFMQHVRRHSGSSMQEGIAWTQQEGIAWTQQAGIAWPAIKECASRWCRGSVQGRALTTAAKTKCCEDMQQALRGQRSGNCLGSGQEKATSNGYTCTSMRLCEQGRQGRAGPAFQYTRQKEYHKVAKPKLAVSTKRRD